MDTSDSNPYCFGVDGGNCYTRTGTFNNNNEPMDTSESGAEGIKFGGGEVSNLNESMNYNKGQPNITTVNTCPFTLNGTYLIM